MNGRGQRLRWSFRPLKSAFCSSELSRVYFLSVERCLIDAYGEDMSYGRPASGLAPLPHAVSSVVLVAVAEAR